MTTKHVNVAYYKKEDWNRFIRSIDDRESMDTTLEEWHRNFLKSKTSLAIMGFQVKEVHVDIDKLARYCRKKGIKNDGRARSQFVVDGQQ